MFSNAIKKLIRTTGFRLVLWYSTIFITSTLLLFTLVYFLLQAAILDKEHDLILTKIEEYGLQDQRGGLAALLDDIRLEENHNSKSGFFVRVADFENKTLLFTLPAGWQIEDIGPLFATGHNSIQGNQFFHKRTRDGEILEIACKRLHNDYLLQVGKGTEERTKLLAHYRKIFAGILLPVILFGLSGGIFLSYRSLRPVRNLISTLRSIDSGKLDSRVPTTQSGDEFDKLTRLFNEMLEKIEQLITGMKESLDNVAHDLRTPVTRLRMDIETALQQDDDPAALREALLDCAEETERIITMLNTLMDISEAETGVMQLNPEKLAVATLISEVIDIYQYVAEDKAITVSRNAPDDLQVVADANRLRQVIANLLDNALKYTPPGGKVSISARADGNQMKLSVADTGCGITDHDLRRIFERLYRADSSRSHRGLGLGLSLVQAVVQSHHGKIEVDSAPNRGSCFTIYWPLESPAPPQAGGGE